MVDLINPCEICPYKLSGPINGGFLKYPNMGVPQNECFIVSNGNSMKIFSKMDDLGVPPFLGNLHIHIHHYPSIPLIIYPARSAAVQLPRGFRTAAPVLQRTANGATAGRWTPDL